MKKKIFVSIISILLLAGIGYIVFKDYHKVYVYEISSDTGFSKNDAYTISYVDGVKDAKSVYDKQNAAKNPLFIFAMNSKEELELTDGKQPIKKNEIAVSKKYATQKKLKLGDVIKTKKGKYTISGFLADSNDVYNCAYTKTSAKQQKDAVSIIVEIIGSQDPKELLSESELKLTQSRIQELNNKINEDINDAETEKKGLISMFKGALETAKEKLTAADKGIKKSDKETSKIGKGLKDAEKVLKEARAELDKASATLKSEGKKLSDSRADLDKAKETYNSTLSSLGMTESELNQTISSLESVLSSAGYSLNDLTSLKGALPAFESNESNIKSTTSNVRSLISQRDSAQTAYNNHIADGHDSTGCADCESYTDSINSLNSQISSGVSSLKGMCNAILFSSVSIEGTTSSMDSIDSRTNSLSQLASSIKNYISLSEVDSLIDFVDISRNLPAYEAEYEAAYKEYQSAVKTYESKEAQYENKVGQLSKNQDEYDKYMKDLAKVKKEYAANEAQFRSNEQEYNDQLETQEKKIEDSEKNKESIVVAWNDATKLGTYYNWIYISVMGGAAALWALIAALLMRKKGTR